MFLTRRAKLRATKPFVTLIAALILAIVLPPPFALARTLKIASIAPDGTTWMKKMRAGAKEIEAKTEGRVKFKFYPGGIMGSEKNVLRKIRVGQLHGGAVTVGTLVGIYPDIQVYNLPMLFRSNAEVDYVRQRVDASLIEGLREKGFIGFGFAEGGFAYFLSQNPVRSAKDLQTQRLWLPEGDEVSRIWLESANVSPVTLPMTDVLTGLQTGLINAIGTSSIGAIAFQWHTKVKYLTDIPLMYLYGTLVINAKTFNKLKPEDQSVTREIMTRVYSELDNMNRKDSEKALAALRTQDIEFVQPTQEGLETLRTSARVATKKLEADQSVSSAILRTVEEHLETFRARQ